MREEKNVRVCVCVFSPAIIIPVKSRFLNPAAQADTLNKIILIPHGKRNENEEINVKVRREEGVVDGVGVRGGWWWGGSHPGPVPLTLFSFRSLPISLDLFGRLDSPYLLFLNAPGHTLSTPHPPPPVQ